MGDDADGHQHLSPMGDSLHHRQPLPLLPDELINDILSLLPVRSLLEFKRVCKSWETLISNPQFVNNHLRNLTVNPSLTHQRVFCYGFNERTSSIVSFPVESLLETPSEPTQPLFEFTKEHNVRKIVGSCNGLLCLFDYDQGSFELWNPCIRFESNKSPPLDCSDYGITYYGFGYDHVNDEYKVLVCRSGTCDDKFEIVTQIYTFGENCWTTIDNFPGNITAMVGEFVSGTLNWITRSVSSNEKVILSFDLEKETFKEVFLPDNYGVKTWNHHTLGVFSNCLYVSFGPIKDHWNLWVMKKYGVAESWTRLTMIPHEQLRNCVNHTPNSIKLLFILKNVVLLSIGITNTFVLFNLNNGRMDKCRLGSCSIGSKSYIYHASLVSPQT